MRDGVAVLADQTCSTCWRPRRLCFCRRFARAVAGHESSRESGCNSKSGRPGSRWRTIGSARGHFAFSPTRPQLLRNKQAQQPPRPPLPFRRARPSTKPVRGLTALCRGPACLSQGNSLKPRTSRPLGRFSFFALHTDPTSTHRTYTRHFCATTAWTTPPEEKEQAVASGASDDGCRRDSAACSRHPYPRCLEFGHGYLIARALTTKCRFVWGHLAIPVVVRRPARAPRPLRTRQARLRSSIRSVHTAQTASRRIASHRTALHNICKDKHTTAATALRIGVDQNPLTARGGGGQESDHQCVRGLTISGRIPR